MDFYLTILSVGRFTPTILSFIFFIYLIQRSAKEIGTFWFAIYFFFLSIYNFGYIIGYSINNGSGSYGWYLACAIVFAAASRIQISFAFPSTISNVPRRFLLFITFLLGIYSFLDYIFKAYGTNELGFSVHAYGSKYSSILIPGFSLLFYLVSIGVSFFRIFRIVSFTQAESYLKKIRISWSGSSDFRITVALICVTVLEISITVFYVLNLNKILSTILLAEIMNIGGLVIFVSYAFVYSSSAAGRTGIITRLVGITLVSFMLVFHLITKFYQEKSIYSYYLHLEESSKINYLVSDKLKHADGIYVQNIPIPKKNANQWELQLIHSFFQASTDGRFHFFKVGNLAFVGIPFEFEGKQAIGMISYDEYRSEIHKILLPSLIFFLFICILILFIFPLLFRANFIIPLNNLMKDLSKLSKESIPKDESGIANEIVTLRNAFEQMADVIKKAKGDMPEVSPQIEILSQILNSEAQKISVGNQTLIYRSTAVRKTLDEVARASRYKYPILITGETGTGKELISRLIHESSEDANGPFVAINCATLPENLWESEIFGHKKGAFTDAKNNRKGRILEASGGSVFFDEIGEMPISIQPKMLRLLQENTFVPLGSDVTLSAECRFIFATNRDLDQLVKQKLFREDLLYRIRVLPIQLPALRERIEDIPHLLRYFVDKFSLEYKIKSPEIDTRLLHRFISYPWPGNIREMENSVIRAMAGLNGEVLGLENFNSLGFDSKLNSDSSPAVFREGKVTSYEEEVKNFSRKLIESVYRENKRNVTKTAEALSMKRTTLRYQLLELGILDAKNDK